MIATVVVAVLLPLSSSFSTTTTSKASIRNHHRQTNGITRRNVFGRGNKEDSDSNTDESDSNEWEDSSSSSTNNDGLNSWSTFQSSEEEELSIDTQNSLDSDQDLIDTSDAWLDTIAAISAEEIEFNQKDNERADKARQMQEWGFDDNVVANTFGVAVDDSMETVDEPAGLKEYREDIYEDDPWEDEDYDSIESHTRVETDPETGESVRQQMVYVDEHACIGCTNCATIADSTFFMESELGRARVFEQWGDTEDTISMAIETCPVDCIHYIPYEELQTLEIQRRGQNINNVARLVNQGESAHMAGIGGGGFTMPQIISGNSGSRCNNCPTRGCKNCPMFGVGKNPEYEKREQIRLERIVRRNLEQERKEQKKSIEL